MYFSKGLNKDELKQEYKKLAKQYHPDVSKDPNATEIMKAINAEFDDYFVKLSTPFIDNKWQDFCERAAKAAARTKAEQFRNMVFYIVNNKYINNGWVAYGLKNITEDTLLYGYSPDIVRVVPKKGHSIHAGFAIGGTFDNNDEILEAEMIDVDPVDDLDIYFEGMRNFTYCRDDIVNLKELPFGIAYVKPDSNTTFVKYDGKISEVQLPVKMVANSRTIETITLSDYMCQKAYGCTADEFKRTHDINWSPRITIDTVRKYKDEAMPYISSPIANHMIRNNIISIYQSKADKKLFWATFHCSIPEILKYCRDDIEEAQEWIDSVNDEYENRVKGMIKKGKIKIKI